MQREAHLYMGGRSSEKVNQIWQSGGGCKQSMTVKSASNLGEGLLPLGDYQVSPARDSGPNMNLNEGSEGGGVHTLWVSY